MRQAVFESSYGKMSWTAAGRGPAMVFVHGTPFSSVVWRKIAAPLSRRFEVFLPDLIGYGRSEKAETVDLSVQGHAFSEWLVHLNLEKPIVVAHDFGGSTALRAHLLHERPFDRLILCDPVAVRPWGTPFARHVREFEHAFSGMPRYAHQAMLEAYVQTACRNPLTPELLSDIVSPWRDREGQAAFYRQIAQIDEAYTEEFEGKLNDIACPTFLLWGADDQWLPVEHGRRLADMIDVEIFRIAENAGHLVQFDAPEEVLALIMDATADRQGESVQ